MAIKKGVKKKEHENLSDANIEKVISLLEAEKPIKKTEACEILNISYNTTRLGKIIEEYKEKIAQEKRMRAANRGKPPSDFETSTVVENYLAGDSVKEIADGLYRSTDFVKRIIDTVGVPRAEQGDTYANYSPLPEQCIRDSFREGEYVWSSKYGSIAEVMKHCGTAQDGSNLYRIYVHQQIDEEKSLVDGKRFAHHVATGGGYYAYQPAYELGSLEHLIKHGVNIKRAIK